MSIRALSVLATAAILATASTSWGQVVAGAPDGATAGDAALGEGGNVAAEEDAGPVDVDAGAADGGSGSSGNDGAPASPGNPFGPGNLFDASNPFGPGDLFDSGDPFDSSDPFGFSEPDVGSLEPPGFPGPGTDPSNGAGGGTTVGPTDQPATDTAATDDASSIASDNGSSGDGGAEVAAWGDAAPAAREIESPSNVAAPVIGCGGCSTSDTGAQGALAVVFAAIAVAWRCRRSHRGPRTRGG
jgi:MYXO-CTERM domain-containing protein